MVYRKNKKSFVIIDFSLQRKIENI